MTFPSLTSLLKATASTYATVTSGAPAVSEPQVAHVMTIGARSDVAAGPVAHLSPSTEWKTHAVARQLGVNDNASATPFGTQYQVQYRDGSNETFNVAPRHCGGLQGTPAFSYQVENSYHGHRNPASRCQVDGGSPELEIVRIHTFEMAGAKDRELAELVPSHGGPYVPGNSSAVECYGINVDGGGNFVGYVEVEPGWLNLVESVTSEKVPCEPMHYSGGAPQGSWSDAATASLTAVGAYFAARVHTR